MTLRKWNEAFYAGIINSESSLFSDSSLFSKGSPFSKASPLPKGSKFELYRTTYIETLKSTAAAIFSETRKLIGERNFNHLAYYYAESHPPKDVDLTFYGKQFPAFLTHNTERFNLQLLPYLSDVASIDFLLHESYYADTRAQWDANALSYLSENSSQEAYATTYLNLSPDIKIFQSDYPIHLIHLLNAGKLEHLALEDGNYYYLIERPEYTVSMKEIEPELFHFLADIQNQTPLSLLVEKHQERTTNLLSNVVTQGYIDNISCALGEYDNEEIKVENQKNCN